MKRLLGLLLFVLFSASPAWATKITVPQQTVTNWQRTTSAPIIRVFANQTFTASTGEIVYKGSPDDGNFYLSITCSIVGSTVTIPTFIIDSTTDGLDVRTTRYTFYWYDNAGNLLVPVDGMSGVQVPNVVASSSGCTPAGTCGIFSDIRVYNAGSPRLDRTDFYDKFQVDQKVLALNPTTTKGDLLTHDLFTSIRLPVGTDNQVLTADSTQPSGLRWATGGGGVSTVFGRSGAVVAATNDYTWAQIDKTISSLADITTRSATDLTSGTLPDARFPATLPILSGANLTNLNASNLATGTVPLVRLSGITNAEISATAGIVDTKLATISTAGKVSDSALSSNIPLKNALSNVFTGDLTVSGLLKLGTTPTTINDAAGKILSASLNTVQVAQGGTGVTSLSDVTGTTNQVTVTGGTARVIGGTVTISLPQNIHTAATPQFSALGLGGASGTASTLKIYGTTSGSITFAVPATAGTNTITFPAGTTNFSTTGGANQVVKQSSAGAALTVAQLGFSELSGTASLAQGGTGSSLTDPAANKIVAWDDTDNTVGFWTLGSGLSYDHTTHTLSAPTGGSGTVTNTGTLTAGQLIKGNGGVDITVGDLTGDVTTSGSMATTISAGAVTYSKIQNVSATSRFLGRITAGAGSTEELTGTQATTLLDVFTSTLKGVVPSSGGGTTNFLRADGTWAAPGGGGGTPGGANTQVQFNDSGAFGGDADFTWDKTNNKLTVVGSIDLNLNGSPSIGNSGFGGNTIEFKNTGNLNFVGQAGTGSYITLNYNPQSSSAYQKIFVITPNVSQSGTGGYALLYGDVTETTVGSGAKNLIDLNVGGVPKFGVTNSGTVSGNIFSGGTFSSNGNWFSLNSSASPTLAFHTTAQVTWGATNLGDPDTGIMRNGAGILEVNNGTAGTFRDLKIRDLTASGVLKAGSTPTTLTSAAGKVLIAAVDATGTPSSTTFLRGDGTWSTPAGSGTVTNTGTLTANAVIVGNGTSDVTALASLGTSGQVLTSNGAGSPPSFQNATGGSPGGSGSEIQYRGGASTFSPVTSSSVSGGQVTWADKQTIALDNATTNVADVLFDVQHSSSGSVANGFGGRIRFGLETTTTLNQDAATIDAIWTNATHVNRTSAIVFSTVNGAGSLTEVGRFDPNGLTASLTNSTNLPVSTGISGLGTNVATFLGSPTSANFAAAITNETGTGVVVFSTSPSLTTPSFSSIVNTGTLTLPTSTDTLVGRATTDTLTNKTLTSPIISTISNTGTLTLPTSTDTLVGRATTDTLTNKTVDPEGTGNVIGFLGKIWIDAAGGTAAAPASNWDLPASNTPTVAVIEGGTNGVLQGVLDFPDGATDLTAQRTWLLPSDWTGAVDVKFRWFSVTISGDVIWGVATTCVADGETNDPTFNSFSDVTDTTKGTANQLNDASITGITTTGCAAGETMHLKIARRLSQAGDTMNGTARLTGVEITYRRNQ